MNDANNPVVIYAILPFLTGKDIVRLESVSKQWRHTILSHEASLFRKALDRERALKRGDYSSFGSEKCMPFSAKDVYKSASMRIEADIARELARKRDHNVTVIGKVWYCVLGLGVLPYYLLLAGGMDALSAAESALLVFVFCVPLTQGQRGVAFSLLSIPCVYVICTPLRPLFAPLSVYVIGFFLQFLAFYCFIRSKGLYALIARIIFSFALLEVYVASWLLLPFPFPVYLLPSLFWCIVRISPAAFACEAFERGTYRYSFAGVIAFVLLECLFSFDLLPFYWLPYYTLAVSLLCIVWVFVVCLCTSPRHNLLLPVFILLFPLCFELWHRVKIPLCPSVAFLIRVLPFIFIASIYSITLATNLEFTHILYATLLAILFAVAAELYFTVSETSVQGMSISCSTRLQGSIISSLLVP